MVQTIRADWDGAWKESLVGLFPWFLALTFPLVHADIDWRRGFEPLDKELQKIARAAATGVKRVDVLFRVWLRSGEERWVLIHIEVQAQPDANFPERLHDLAHLKARETVGDTARRRQWKVRLLKGLYRRGWVREDVRRLLTAIDWFLTLPRDDDRLVREEIEADEKEKQMPYITSFEQMAMEEGEAKGLKGGIAVALRLKFGEAGKLLIPELRQINDLDTLKRVTDSIEAASSVDDVRRIWSGC